MCSQGRSAWMTGLAGDLLGLWTVRVMLATALTTPLSKKYCGASPITSSVGSRRGMGWVSVTEGEPAGATIAGGSGFGSGGAVSRAPDAPETDRLIELRQDSERRGDAGDIAPASEARGTRVTADGLPLIGLMLGDACGIGPEVAVKAMASGAVVDRARVAIVGDVRVLEQGMRDAN